MEYWWNSVKTFGNVGERFKSCDLTLNAVFRTDSDEIEKETLLARDRYGEKPLYYFFENGRLDFSSDAFLLAKLVSPTFILINSLKVEFSYKVPFVSGT